uniref:Uncharacterized protein n=1 Tax=viral metagenome TaxID=1070528 RepID=A0A6C0AYK8_9ZZZZ|tara:strand:- start:36465 stop:36986 length:522 start_codon:yes stop_codon:yes gene_type:complete
MSFDECQELKNIKYKTMLLNGNKKLLSSITNDISNIDLLLDEENAQNKKESWNKLDKSIKMDKINDYIVSLTSKYKLNKLEIKNLREYLSSNLDKKNLYKNKEVTYIKESGKLENIHNLHFNNSTRKFTLRKNVQHVSTAKALGPTRKKNKSKSNRGKLSNSPRSESPKSECS